MRKVNPLETLKIITKIILLMSICIKVSAQSPYAMFGDNSKMLEANSESVPSIYRVGVQSTNGVNLYADFDMNKGMATLYDAEGNVLRQDSIGENTKAMFTTIDPHAESYYHLSPYSYCGGDPVNAIDPDGKIVIFINGMHNGSGGTYRYWDNFDSQVMVHFKDFNAKYYDGARGGTKGLGLGKWSVLDDPYVPNSVKKQVVNSIYSNLSAEDRYNDGYNTGANEVKNIISSLGEGEMIRIISHSMGGAYAKGFVQSLVDYIRIHPEYSYILGNIVEYDFAPFQPNQQSAVNGIPTFQYSHRWDLVAGDSPISGAKQQATSNEWSSGHSITNFIQYVQSLPAGKYKVVNGQIVPQ